MKYPDIPDLIKTLEQITEYTKLKHEYNSEDIEVSLTELDSQMKKILSDIKQLPVDDKKALKEPNALSEIRKLRPDGPRKLDFDYSTYKEKLEGAFYSRIAGCILGAPVEFHSIDEMKNWAKYTGDDFPPTKYWSKIKSPYELRYGKSDFCEYTNSEMTKAPVDDDITYTILGLLIVEEYGNEFTTEDVGKAWLKYLPYACTAEEVAIRNLKNGVKASEVADVDNPYCQWIGADIRSDSFAYIAPGQPEKAAEMAYNDAYLSHRRNGIYGSMFFAAAQSAAFVVSSAVDAIEIGLTEIPEHCDLAIDVRWALEVGKDIKNYREARKLVNERFVDMSHAHTNNNACLTIFGLMIGGNDMTKVISECVAMGMDNDCTAATAGSIVGAIVGKSNVKEHWYSNFNNIVDTYIIGVGELEMNDVINRFIKQADLISRG